MSAHPERAQDYLERMREAIARIRTYTEDMELVGFLNNPMTQDAVIRNLEIIGEAARKIQKNHPEFARLHPQLPLDQAYTTRNWLSHGYFKINLEIVWQTIEIDLPDLEMQIAHLLGDQQLKGLD